MKIKIKGGNKNVKIKINHQEHAHDVRARVMRARANLGISKLRTKPSNAMIDERFQINLHNIALYSTSQQTETKNKAISPATASFLVSSSKPSG